MSLSYKLSYLSFIRKGVLNKVHTLRFSRRAFPSKGIAMKVLYCEILHCRKCIRLREDRRPVPGEGDLDARLFIIGESPSNHGYRPFVGPSGRILEELLLRIGIVRDKVYLTNLIKCKLPPGKMPKPKEIALCSPYLDQEIKIIKPKVIVTLGRLSTQYLLGKIGKVFKSLSNIHGNIYRASILGIRTTLIPTYHPAAIMYNPKIKILLERDFHIIRRVIQQESHYAR